MTILVTGSRKYADGDRVRDLLLSFCPTVVVHGAARGADELADRIAKARGIEVRTYPADWKTWGRAAGAMRNSEMLKCEKIDLVVAFPLPGSIGTWDMVRKAKRAGVRVVIA